MDGVAPDFVEPLHTHRAEVGDTVEWECKIIGEPAPGDSMLSWILS